MGVGFSCAYKDLTGDEEWYELFNEDGEFEFAADEVVFVCTVGLSLGIGVVFVELDGG